MVRNIIDKIMFKIYKWSSDYVYSSFNINRDNIDEDFWEDDFK